MPKRNLKKPRRFWEKVDVGDLRACWEWQAGKDSHGYGIFSIHQRKWGAHRVAWTLTYGNIPKGLLVCHHCDNPGCCNPYHLFLGTQVDNMADAARKGRASISKLSTAEVLEIRRLYAAGGWTQKELAKEFGVRNCHISKILRRETRRYI